MPDRTEPSILAFIHRERDNINRFIHRSLRGSSVTIKYRRYRNNRMDSPPTGGVYEQDPTFRTFIAREVTPNSSRIRRERYVQYQLKSLMLMSMLKFKECGVSSSRKFDYSVYTTRDL